MEQPSAPITPLGSRTPLAHPGLYVVIGLLSVIIIAGATWTFWHSDSPRPAASPTPTPSVQPAARVSWGGVSFTVPDHWIAEPIGYRTPAQEASGETGDVVGYAIIPQGFSIGSAGQRTISLGGQQQGGATCADELYKSYASDCRTLAASPENGATAVLSTGASDAETMSAFQFIAKQLIKQTLILPAKELMTIEHRDTRFGLTVQLPTSWKGYRDIGQEGEGTAWHGIDMATNKETEGGPMVVLRHPLSTEALPRQDIPIMVFTPRQWEGLMAEQFSVGAAPIPPSILASNSSFVFALPARYNYAFPAGWEEVDQVIRFGAVDTYER